MPGAAIILLACILTVVIILVALGVIIGYALDIRPHTSTPPTPATPAALSPSLAPILAEVAAECARAQANWGKANYPPEFALALLSAELGEVSREVTSMFRLRHRQPDLANYRVELVQIASFAIRMVEAYDARSGRLWGFFNRVRFYFHDRFGSR